MGTMPTHIDDITARWLADATGLDVQDVAIEQIGVGIGVSSALYRVHLTGAGLPSDRGGEAAGARRGGGVHLDDAADVHA